MTIFAWAIAALWALGQAGPTLGADELASRVQQRYDTIRDFQADFEQTYEGGLLRTRTTERGSVAIKRPGRMRWLYTAPEKKEFVSDGIRIYSYLPEDRQVIVSPMPDDEATAPAMFLAGRGNLTRDYTASRVELTGAPRGLVGLRLAPRRPDPEYTALTLGVDPATFQIRFLAAEDRQGGRSTFTFTNLRENRGLSDKMFEFRIPRGVDVITNGVPK